MQKHNLVRLFVITCIGGMALTPLPAGAGAQINPDASFNLTVSKEVVGGLAAEDFDFELTCSSDEGDGEASFVSIDDPTFPGFESSDSVNISLADGEEESVQVYVEFSRNTVITCRAEETGATNEPDSTAVGCIPDAYLECTDPVVGGRVEQDFGEATLAWADIPDFPIESAGGVTFAFLNTYDATTTTAGPTTTTAAAAAATATPRFTG